MTQLPAPSLSQLPESFICHVEQLGAIQVTGEDSQKYLQGQLTCDVQQITDTNMLMGGQCNPTGKLLSVFRMVKAINEDSGYLLIQPNSSIESSLPELKKYGVFSKVDIEQTNDLSFALLVGSTAQAQIKAIAGVLPDSLTQVVTSEDYHFIALGGEPSRYLTIAKPAAIESLMAEFDGDKLSHRVWDLLEITQGIANIPATVAGEYVPQMVNLTHINGVSFTKGCYLGQETVARMQYLGKNKRALFVLAGENVSHDNLAELSTVEVQLGENWRRNGMLVNTYLSDDKTFYGNAILNSDTEEAASLRLKELPSASLTIQPLPYSLEQA